MDFRIYTAPDGSHVGCGIWQRLVPQNDNLFEFITSASVEESNNTVQTTCSMVSVCFFFHLCTVLVIKEATREDDSAQKFQANRMHWFLV